MAILNSVINRSDVVQAGSMTVFPKEEFQSREDALKKEMAAQEIELLLVTTPENIFYLTGQQTPGYYTFQCLGIPLEGAPFLVLRQLEFYNAKSNTFITDLFPYQDDADPAEVLAEILENMGWMKRRVAIERSGWFLSVVFFGKLTNAIEGLLDGSGIVEKLRRVKSTLEVEAIEKAAKFTDAGMQEGIEAAAVMNTENDVAAAMFAGVVGAGSEYMGMDPFVTSGSRSGIPHTTWRRRVLKQGDAVLLELAGCYNRYHAGLMRTAWLGKVPQKAVDMMKACEDGLSAALYIIKPGNTCAAVHNACQAVIDQRGYTENFKKRTGYSIGIAFAPDWGEGHILSLFHDVDALLEPGMVFHIPPALREYGKFAVGVSETVVVTDNGYRTLSTLKRSMQMR